VGRWPIVTAALCACALLAGCGAHIQRKTAPAPYLQRACLNAKQLATLQREIRNVSIPGDKSYAFRDVVVWGGCFGKKNAYAAIADKTSQGEYEHVTINRAGRITSTGHPFVPGP
jgi:hypothetical protein